MPDLFNLTPQMNDYLNSLPESVRNSIKESTAKINSLEDLKAVAEEMKANG